MKLINLLLTAAVTCGLNTYADNAQLCKAGTLKINEAIKKYKVEFNEDLKINDNSLRTLVNEEYLKQLPQAPVGGFYYSNKKGQIACSFVKSDELLPTKFEKLHEQSEESSFNSFWGNGDPKPETISNEKVNQLVSLASQQHYADARDKMLKKFVNKYDESINSEQLVVIASYAYYANTKDLILKTGLKANVIDYKAKEVIAVASHSYYANTKDYILKYYSRKNKSTLSHNEFILLANSCYYANTQRYILNLAQDNL
ncbi:MAG: hypothetical protein KC646_04010 [Candidatus Cloacimonetes bacterium]|nr:hypothetical protein [Candidatus Cloacimonadota bacterium]